MALDPELPVRAGRWEQHAEPVVAGPVLHLGEELDALDAGGQPNTGRHRAGDRAGGAPPVIHEPVDPDDEYAWHTGINRPTGVPDAVEFIDVHKAFGRNKILRGLNMGLPEARSR